MNKRFKEFLIENDALEAYEENLQLRELTCLPEDFICSAFSWGYTWQGDTYWRELDKLWREECL